MKKTIIIFSLAAMAGLTLAGCNGDYDDWASPQSYSQESAAAKYGVSFAAGLEANDNADDADGMVSLVLISSPDTAVAGYSLNSLTINGSPITGTIDGDTVKVDALQLEQLVCQQQNSRASVARSLDVKTNVSINLNGNKQIDYLTGSGDNVFTGYMYLDQQGFTFYNWDGSAIATNNAVSQDGYYKVSVDLSSNTTTYTLISRIGIIVDATADGWGADQPMTYNKDERCWELKDVTMKAGTFKFRANNGWDINWGGTADALKQGGDNISVDAGTYDIKLYAWADGKAYLQRNKPEIISPLY